jgi:hypothetical protein
MQPRKFAYQSPSCGREVKPADESADNERLWLGLYGAQSANERKRKLWPMEAKSDLRLSEALVN